MPSKKPILRAYVEPSVKKQFKEIAKLHERSCSAELSYIIKKHINKCGTLCHPNSN